MEVCFLNTLNWCVPSHVSTDVDMVSVHLARIPGADGSTGDWIEL
jgi:hypothetical protein